MIGFMFGTVVGILSKYLYDKFTTDKVCVQVIDGIKYSTEGSTLLYKDSRERFYKSKNNSYFKVFYYDFVYSITPKPIDEIIDILRRLGLNGDQQAIDCLSTHFDIKIDIKDA